MENVKMILFYKNFMTKQLMKCLSIWTTYGTKEIWMYSKTWLLEIINFWLQVLQLIIGQLSLGGASEHDAILLTAQNNEMKLIL